MFKMLRIRNTLRRYRGILPRVFLPGYNIHSRSLCDYAVCRYIPDSDCPESPVSECARSLHIYPGNIQSHIPLCSRRDRQGSNPLYLFRDRNSRDRHEHVILTVNIGNYVSCHISALYISRWIQSYSHPIFLNTDRSNGPPSVSSRAITESS